ncbi:sensor histidine kinase, partial [Streptomyces triticirhizae]
HAPAATAPAAPAQRRPAPERRESGLWVDAFFAGIRAEPEGSPPADDPGPGPGEAERPSP